MRRIGTTKKRDLAPYALIGGVLVLAFLCCYWQIELEKRAYNRLTGGNATWWDAAVLDLRIIGTPAKSETNQ